MTGKLVAILDNKDSQDMVKALCKENGIRFEVFDELVKMRFENVGKQMHGNRRRLFDSFDNILDRIAVKEEE